MADVVDNRILDGWDPNATRRLVESLTNSDENPGYQKPSEGLGTRRGNGWSPSNRLAGTLDRELGPRRSASTTTRLPQLVRLGQVMRRLETAGDGARLASTSGCSSPRQCDAAGAAIPGPHLPITRRASEPAEIIDLYLAEQPA